MTDQDHPTRRHGAIFFHPKLPLPPPVRNQIPLIEHLAHRFLATQVSPFFRDLTRIVPYRGLTWLTGVDWRHRDNPHFFEILVDASVVVRLESGSRNNFTYNLYRYNQGWTFAVSIYELADDVLALVPVWASERNLLAASGRDQVNISATECLDDGIWLVQKTRFGYRSLLLRDPATIALCERWQILADLGGDAATG